MKNSTKGALAASLSFFLWGLFPIFWKLFDGGNPLELTAHRVLWTLAMLIPVLAFRGSLQATLAAFKSPKVIATHALAATCLATNWLIFVWAVVNDRVLEAALGYYLNPFLYILLGRLVLREKHSSFQLLAIAIAAAGVALQFFAIDGIPWASLSIAVTFAAYGLLKKKSALGPFSGLAMEMAILTPIALLYGGLLINSSQSAFGADFFTTFLLIATGLVTAIPLLLFARGVRTISLSLLGILQFIAPTGQFLIGWLVYGEPLPSLRLASFSLIWIAVIFYIVSQRRSTMPLPEKVPLT
ncbi:MAG: EamA family transporter RarD [Verrucomicrobia bacterium]|nr:EamA family transporter RarD [Verrucomicrobiota bacterium]